MLGSPTVRTLVVASTLALTFGCKGKPKPQAAPGSGKVETTAGSKPATPHDVDLPHGPGTPPVKSSRPVTKDILQKLAEMDFPEFVKDVRGVGDDSMYVIQQIPSHPVLRANIHVQACTTQGARCWPMDLATWQSHKEELQSYVPAELKTEPSTTFEIGQTELHGTPMFYTYQLGEVVDKKSSWTEAYVLYYHDDFNEIRIVAEYKDDMPASKEAMAKMLPREDLENTAKAFVDVYTHAWQP